MLKRRIFVAAMVLIPGVVLASPVQGDFSLPAPSGGPERTMQLWATHYYVHSAKGAADGIPYRNKQGEAISDNVSPRDWCLGAIEGTIQAPFNGSLATLNYDAVGTTSQVNCAAVLNIDPGRKPWIVKTGMSYFTKARGPYGDGVQGYKLVPYRTIAVDRSAIQYGTVLFIPRARGLEFLLPTGERIKHDGYFFAGDTGGAIKASHIDIFCGSASTNCFPSFVWGKASRKFDAIVITDPATIVALRAQHTN